MSLRAVAVTAPPAPHAPHSCGMDSLVELDLLNDDASDVVSPAREFQRKGSRSSLVKDENPIKRRGLLRLQDQASRKGTPKRERPIKCERSPRPHDGQSDGSVAELQLVAAEDDDEAESTEEKLCTGFKRSYETGICWVTGDPLQWGLPRGRGNWCKDCFNLWRLVWGSRTNLIMFALWLESEENWRTWELHLVAALMMKKEGVERLTTEKLAARVVALSFALQLLGLPFGPMVVTRFRDLGAFENLDSLRRVQVVEKRGASEKQACLGYLLDAEPLPQSGSCVQRPCTSGAACLATRSALTTQCAEYLDLLKLAFPDAPDALMSPRLVAQCQPPGASGSCAAMADQSANDIRVDSTMAWALSQLQAYKGADWPSVRETHFTTTMNRFMDLKSNLAHEGDEHNVQKVEEWLGKLGVGKLVTKKYKELMKGQKLAKLQCLSPSLSEWVTFLRSQKLHVHYTLVQLHLKVLFVAHSGSYDKKLQLIIQEGLVCVLNQMPASASISAESWLRSVVFVKFAMDIEAAQVQECDAVRKNWITAMEGMVEVLDKAELASALQTLINDLGVLVIMLQAGCEHTEVSVADAASCMEALSSSRFTLLRDALTKAPAGIEFASAVKELLQRRASDGVGGRSFSHSCGGVRGLSHVAPLCARSLRPQLTSSA